MTDTIGIIVISIIVGCPIVGFSFLLALSLCMSAKRGDQAQKRALRLHQLREALS